jgi:predicted glutamine amidotransferase
MQHKICIEGVSIDDGRASDSALATFLRSFPIHPPTVLAHVRKTTQVSVRLANCQPFVRKRGGRYWSFCHNGDVLDFAPPISGVHLSVGEEQVWCGNAVTTPRAGSTRKPKASGRLAAA